MSAKRRRNSMSCSMTTMVRSRPMRLEQLAGLVALLGWLMPATGSSSSITLGVLHEQHPDLQPLLLPVGEDARRAVAQRA